MRRWTTISLLAAMLAFYLVPLSASASESGIPFCCRAKGKHHCEMSGGTASAELGFQSPNRCPYRNPASSLSQQITAAPAQTIGSLRVPMAEDRIQVHQLFSSGVTLRLTPDKRGPPVLL